MKRPKPHPTPHPKVKNKAKRRLLHAMWIKIVQGPIISTALELDYLIRTQGDGLTEKEVEFLKQRVETLNQVGHDFNKIYYRLKF